MTNNADMNSGGTILLQLTTPDGGEGPVVLNPDDLKRFNGADPLYQALRQVFGGRLAQISLKRGVLHMKVNAEEREGLTYDLQSFMDDVEATAGELRRNASLARPLPFAEAVRRPTLVAILQATSRVHHAFGLDPVSSISDQLREFPVLAPTDFIQPEPNRELRKPGMFLIKGLVRDDRRGHQLLVTDNELHVQLPIDSPRWTWHAIHHVLDEQTVLEGTLVRESKSCPWTIDDTARLKVQPDLLEAC